MRRERHGEMDVEMDVETGESMKEAKKERKQAGSHRKERETNQVGQPQHMTRNHFAAQFVQVFTVNPGAGGPNSAGGAAAVEVRGAGGVRCRSFLPGCPSILSLSCLSTMMPRFYIAPPILPVSVPLWG